MKICHVEYADFVVWKEEDLFVQRIPIEKEFIEDAMERVAPFVKLAILPEVVGKWFTRQKTSLSEERTTQQCDVTNEGDEQV